MGIKVSRLLRGKLAGVALLFLVGCILTVGYTLHSSRTLNLSGDEVHFAFQGLRQWSGNDAPYYADTLSKLDEVDGSRLGDPVATNYALAQKYFTLQRLYYDEYTLPKLVWSAATKVSDARERRQPQYDLARFLGESVFWMLAAGMALTLAGFLWLTWTLDWPGRIAVLAAIVVLALRDASPLSAWIEQSISSSGGWAVMVKSLASANKDFMIFGQSARSQFMLLLVGVCVMRWRRFETGSTRLADTALLPVLALVHATSGAMTAVAFLVVDLLRSLHGRRIPGSPRLFVYALTFGLAAKSGSFALGGTHAIAYAGALSVLGLGVLSLRWSHAEPGTPWRAGPVLDVALVVGACVLYSLGSLVIGRMNLDSESLWRYTLTGERFGAIAAVIVITGIVYLCCRKLGGRIPEQAPAGAKWRTGLSAAALVAGVAMLALAHPLDSLGATRARLNSHARDFEAATHAPLQFQASNELHLLWLGVIKSMLADRDFTSAIALPKAPGVAASGPGRFERATARSQAGLPVVPDGKAACFITRVDGDAPSDPIRLDPAAPHTFEGWAADRSLQVPLAADLVLKSGNGTALTFQGAKTTDKSRAAEVFNKPELVNAGYIVELPAGSLPEGEYEVLVKQTFAEQVVLCPVGSKRVVSARRE